jgi:2-polyprenyl-3-methyl-5-hydroxy-6-metoxy-1,4-benzoquinol methylase
MPEKNLAYLNYWKRKEYCNQAVPIKRISFWVDSDGSPSENLIDDYALNSKSVLDFGAGNLKIKERLSRKGFKGEYFSFDSGSEYDYSFNDFSSITRSFDTVLFIDVIEHLDLEDGLELTIDLLEKLNPGGNLILQTPNGKCIRNHLGSDMTHKQLYNINDLYSYFKALGYEVFCHRVCFDLKEKSIIRKIITFLGRLITAKLIGVDYADNILLRIKKPS